MALILRLQKGSSLTNEELDNNFIFLNEVEFNLQSQIDVINNSTIPDFNTALVGGLAYKQPLNPQLTSLADVTAPGVLVISSGVVTPRTINSGSTNVVVTNGSGIDGNPTIDIGSNVVTKTGTFTLSNKTISGNNNSITDISLVSSVSGVLPVAKGGTGTTSPEATRVSLSAVKVPSTLGVVVSSGVDTTVARTIQTSGNGISIVNGSGVGGDPLITSNATSANAGNTAVFRDGAGNFAAGTITANLNGNAATSSIASSANQAAKLTTARTINGVAFDGTQNISINTADTTKLPLSGGNMWGYLTLNADPVNGSHAATKQYVDNAIASISSSTNENNRRWSLLSTFGGLYAPSKQIGLGDDQLFFVGNGINNPQTARSTYFKTTIYSATGTPGPTAEFSAQNLSANTMRIRLQTVMNAQTDDGSGIQLRDGGTILQTVNFPSRAGQRAVDLGYYDVPPYTTRVFSLWGVIWGGWNWDMLYMRSFTISFVAWV